MRYLLGMLLCLSLVAAGCSLHPPESKEDLAAEAQVASQGFDALQNTSKLVMTTKMGSDMPNSWEYDGADAHTKMSKLLPVLKSGTALPKSDAINNQHTVPQVTFEVQLGGSMQVINVYDDRFSYAGNWYHLDKAPVATYGSVEKLQGQ